MVYTELESVALAAQHVHITEQTTTVACFFSSIQECKQAVGTIVRGLQTSQEARSIPHSSTGYFIRSTLKLLQGRINRAIASSQSQNSLSPYYENWFC